MDKITKISITGLPEPKDNIFSNALMCGNQVFISGMIADDTSGGAYDQSKSCLDKIKRIVEGVGGRLDDVVKLNIYLTDMANRPDFGKARSELFSGRMPCSTLVEVAALANPDALVEVEATAFVGAGT